MPEIINNFDNDIIQLISAGEILETKVFDATKDHYVRMTVFDSNDNLIKSYYSNITWDNIPVYYTDDDSGAGEAAGDIDGPEFKVWYRTTGLELSTPYDSVTGIQLPLYFDSAGNFYVKPNSTLANDPSFDYEESYRLLLLFL